jgi:hypothetical protein
MWIPEGITEIHAGFRRRNLRERDYLEDLGLDGNTLILTKEGVWACNICIWVKVGKSRGFFGIRNDHAGAIICRKYHD